MNAQEEDDIARQAEEVPGVRVQTVPPAPSAREIEEHAALHEPYRAWCPVCIAGRGVSDRHVWRAADASAVPVVGVDYGFFAPKDEGPEGTPVLCGKDTRHKWYYAVPMPCKGTGDPWCAKALAGTLARAGFARLVLRSDTEAAILALKRAAALILTTAVGTEVVMEDGSVGDSAGNGLAEQGVREIKAKTRSLAHAVRTRLGVRLGPQHRALLSQPGPEADGVCVDYTVQGYYLGRTGTFESGLPSSAFVDRPPSISACELEMLHSACVERINEYRSGAKTYTSDACSRTDGCPESAVVAVPPLQEMTGVK